MTISSIISKTKEIFKKPATIPISIMVTVIVIITTLSFGLGYIFRGEIKHASIIIEKYSD